MKSQFDHIKIPFGREWPPARRQSGLVLVIGLIFLLLLTIIGVSAVQNSTLQERMAANSDDRNKAFQSAEIALQAGEIFVMDADCGPLEALLVDNPDPDQANWVGATTVDVPEGNGAIPPPDGEYLVTQIALVEGDGSQPPPTPGFCPGFYFVTARSISDKGMPVVLQSTIVKRF